MGCVSSKDEPKSRRTNSTTQTATATAASGANANNSESAAAANNNINNNHHPPIRTDGRSHGGDEGDGNNGRVGGPRRRDSIPLHHNNTDGKDERQSPSSSSLHLSPSDKDEAERRSSSSDPKGGGGGDGGRQRARSQESRSHFDPIPTPLEATMMGEGGSRRGGGGDSEEEEEEESEEEGGWRSAKRRSRHSPPPPLAPSPSRYELTEQDRTNAQSAADEYQQRIEARRRADEENMKRLKLEEFDPIRPLDSFNVTHRCLLGRCWDRRMAEILPVSYIHSLLYIAQANQIRQQQQQQQQDEKEKEEAEKRRNNGARGRDDENDEMHEMLDWEAAVCAASDGSNAGASPKGAFSPYRGNGRSTSIYDLKGSFHILLPRSTTSAASNASFTTVHKQNLNLLGSASGGGAAAPLAGSAAKHNLHVNPRVSNGTALLGAAPGSAASNNSNSNSNNNAHVFVMGNNKVARRSHWFNVCGVATDTIPANVAYRVVRLGHSTPSTPVVPNSTTAGGIGSTTSAGGDRAFPALATSRSVTGMISVHSAANMGSGATNNTNNINSSNSVSGEGPGEPLPHPAHLTVEQLQALPTEQREELYNVYIKHVPRYSGIKTAHAFKLGPEVSQSADTKFLRKRGLRPAAGVRCTRWNRVELFNPTLRTLLKAVAYTEGKAVGDFLADYVPDDDSPLYYRSSTNDLYGPNSGGSNNNNSNNNNNNAAASAEGAGQGLMGKNVYGTRDALLGNSSFGQHLLGQGRVNKSFANPSFLPPKTHGESTSSFARAFGSGADGNGGKTRDGSEPTSPLLGANASGSSTLVRGSGGEAFPEESMLALVLANPPNVLGQLKRRAQSLQARSLSSAAAAGTSTSNGPNGVAPGGSNAESADAPAPPASASAATAAASVRSPSAATRVGDLPGPGSPAARSPPAPAASTIAPSTTFVALAVSSFSVSIDPFRWEENGYIRGPIDVDHTSNDVQRLYGEGVVTQVMYGGTMIVECSSAAAARALESMLAEMTWTENRSLPNVVGDVRAQFKRRRDRLAKLAAAASKGGGGGKGKEKGKEGGAADTAAAAEELQQHRYRVCRRIGGRPMRNDIEFQQISLLFADDERVEKREETIWRPAAAAESGGGGDASPSSSSPTRKLPSVPSWEEGTTFSRVASSWVGVQVISTVMRTWGIHLLANPEYALPVAMYLQRFAGIGPVLLTTTLNDAMLADSRLNSPTGRGGGIAKNNNSSSLSLLGATANSGGGSVGGGGVSKGLSADLEDDSLAEMLRLEEEAYNHFFEGPLAGAHRAATAHREAGAANTSDHSGNYAWAAGADGAGAVTAAGAGAATGAGAADGDDDGGPDLALLSRRISKSNAFYAPPPPPEDSPADVHTDPAIHAGGGGRRLTVGAASSVASDGEDGADLTMAPTPVHSGPVSSAVTRKNCSTYDLEEAATGAEAAGDTAPPTEVPTVASSSSLNAGRHGRRRGSTGGGSISFAADSQDDDAQAGRHGQRPARARPGPRPLLTSSMMRSAESLDGLDSASFVRPPRTLPGTAAGSPVETADPAELPSSPPLDDAPPSAMDDAAQRGVTPGGLQQPPPPPPPPPTTTTAAAETEAATTAAPTQQQQTAPATTTTTASSLAMSGSTLIPPSRLRQQQQHVGANNTSGDLLSEHSVSSQGTLIFCDSQVARQQQQQQLMHGNSHSGIVQSSNSFNLNSNDGSVNARLTVPCNSCEEFVTGANSGDNSKNNNNHNNYNNNTSNAAALSSEEHSTLPPGGPSVATVADGGSTYGLLSPTPSATTATFAPSPASMHKARAEAEERWNMALLEVKALQQELAELRERRRAAEEHNESLHRRLQVLHRSFLPHCSSTKEVDMMTLYLHTIIMEPEDSPESHLHVRTPDWLAVLTAVWTHPRNTVRNVEIACELQWRDLPALAAMAGLLHYPSAGGTLERLEINATGLLGTHPQQLGGGGGGEGGEGEGEDDGHHHPNHRRGNSGVSKSSFGDGGSTADSAAGTPRSPLGKNKGGSSSGSGKGKKSGGGGFWSRKRKAKGADAAAAAGGGKGGGDDPLTSGSPLHKRGGSNVFDFFRSGPRQTAVPNNHQFGPRMPMFFITPEQARDLLWLLLCSVVRYTSAPHVTVCLRGLPAVEVKPPSLVDRIAKRILGESGGVGVGGDPRRTPRPAMNSFAIVTESCADFEFTYSHSTSFALSSGAIAPAAVSGGGGGGGGGSASMAASSTGSHPPPLAPLSYNPSTAGPSTPRQGLNGTPDPAPAGAPAGGTALASYNPSFVEFSGSPKLKGSGGGGGSSGGGWTASGASSHPHSPLLLRRPAASTSAVGVRSDFVHVHHAMEPRSWMGPRARVEVLPFFSIPYHSCEDALAAGASPGHYHNPYNKVHNCRDYYLSPARREELRAKQEESNARHAAGLCKPQHSSASNNNNNDAESGAAAGINGNSHGGELLFNDYTELIPPPLARSASQNTCTGDKNNNNNKKKKGSDNNNDNNTNNLVQGNFSYNVFGLQSEEEERAVLKSETENLANNVNGIWDILLRSVKEYNREAAAAAKKAREAERQRNKNNSNNNSNASGSVPGSATRRATAAQQQQQQNHNNDSDDPLPFGGRVITLEK